MLKKKLFWQAILISVLTCAAVMLFAALLSRYQAKEELESYLRDVADQVVLRSNRVFDGSGLFLSQLDHLSSHDCGKTHQKLLGEIAFDEMFVRNVLYAPDGFVLCSATDHQTYPLPSRDYQTRQGRSLWFDFQGGLPKQSMLYGTGPHFAVIDSQYLVDVLPAKKRQLYIEAVLENRVLARTHNFKAKADDTWLSQSQVSKSNPNYVITAYLPPTELQRAWLEYFKDLLPLCIVLCLLLIGGDCLVYPAQLYHGA